MTELYFLDKNFRILEGPVEDMTSVVWSERYFEPGVFTFHFPRELMKRLDGASYVRSGVNTDGQVFCGRIEYLRADTDGDCEMGGRFLECLLGDRVLRGGPWSGTVTEAVLAAVRDNLRNSPVVIGDTHASVDGETDLTAGWEEMGSWVYSALRPYGPSFRVLLAANDVPGFCIVRGGTKEDVIFSASFGNIFSIETRRDAADMKNAVYVEGRDGEVVCADNSGGGEMREMHQKAADIDPDSFADKSAYRMALLRRGFEILAKHPMQFAVSAEIDTDALPVYGADYCLGDECTVVDEELGVRMLLRLTQVDWVTENGKTSVYPVFGL